MVDPSTMPAHARTTVDTDRLRSWLIERGHDIVGPLHAQPMPGGRSMLTYHLSDSAGLSLVLRRPPFEMILPTAHDVGREYLVLSSLASTQVPVPPVGAQCVDVDVIGAPFYVMQFVPGRVLHTIADGAGFSETARSELSRDFIRVLARLHSVDVDAVGLGALGRREGYIERQLRRWHLQWQQSMTRELPLIDEVHRHLLGHVPAQQRVGLVHGDYGIHNSLVSDSGRILAVLDWELSTLGDPLADLGLVLARWSAPRGRANEEFLPVTSLSGFATPAELVRGYSAASSRDLTDLDYYVAFAHWKLACIGAGVFTRYSSGAMGETTIDVESMWQDVVYRAEMAHALCADGR